PASMEVAFRFWACSTLFSPFCAWSQPGRIGLRSVPPCMEGSKIAGSSSNSGMIYPHRFGCRSRGYARLRLREKLAQCGHEIEGLWDPDTLRHAVSIFGDECRPTLTMQPARRAAIGACSCFAQTALLALDDHSGGEKAD